MTASRAGAPEKPRPKGAQPGSFKINNQCTPDAIYFVLAQCISGGNAKDAIFLYYLAEVFGKFDCQRVADSSAHQILPSLKMFALQEIDPAKKRIFVQELGNAQKNDAIIVGVQNRIKKIGPPIYFPAYMVTHGLGAMIGSLGGESRAAFVKDFDAERAWKAALAHSFGDYGAIPAFSPLDEKIEIFLRTIHPELFFGSKEHQATLDADISKQLLVAKLPGSTSLAMKNRETAFHATMEPIISEMMAYNHLLKSQVFQFYKQNLSEAEIQSLIEFHKNGLGKKWNALRQARDSIIHQSVAYVSQLRSRINGAIVKHYPELVKKSPKKNMEKS